jgi:enamine deaminase RidA (YjgF/YER057c/UK114 family)
MNIAQRLIDHNITIPDLTVPIANYKPFAISNNTVFISGQLPMLNGKVEHTGKLGDDYSIEQGQQAARLCGLNIIAHLKTALDGNLERVKSCIKLGGFINAAPDFTDHPKVLNGSSDLMVEVFGDKGRHARFAMGAGSLPLGVAVEVDGLFEIEG